jgi:hypothetical protein
MDRMAACLQGAWIGDLHAVNAKNGDNRSSSGGMHEDCRVYWLAGHAQFCAGRVEDGFF